MSTVATSQERAVFVTTQWTSVLDARTVGGAGSDEAMARLCRTYWSPLHAYLLREGWSPADADDLTQGFFAKLLSGVPFAGVDPAKGRFRSYLLKALRHHVANSLRDQRARRRGGGAEHVGLEAVTPSGVESDTLATAPASEIAYDREWARTVLEAAAVGLRSDYESTGRGPLFEVLRRFLAAEPRAGEYAERAPTLGLTEGAMAAAVFRLRRRFRDQVRSRVAETVQSPSEVDDEMRHLLRILIETGGP